MENNVDYIAEHGCYGIKPSKCPLRNVKGDPCQRCDDIRKEHLGWSMVFDISRERARQEIFKRNLDQWKTL